MPDSQRQSGGIRKKSGSVKGGNRVRGKCGMLSMRITTDDVREMGRREHDRKRATMSVLRSIDWSVVRDQARISTDMGGLVRPGKQSRSRSGDRNTTNGVFGRGCKRASNTIDTVDVCVPAYDGSSAAKEVDRQEINIKRLTSRD